MRPSKVPEIVLIKMPFTFLSQLLVASVCSLKPDSQREGEAKEGVLLVSNSRNAIAFRFRALCCKVLPRYIHYMCFLLVLARCKCLNDPLEFVQTSEAPIGKP